MHKYIIVIFFNSLHRITVRAVYNAGESCDSNPIIASLDAHMRTALANDNGSVCLNAEQSGEITNQISDGAGTGGSGNNDTDPSSGDNSESSGAEGRLQSPSATRSAPSSVEQTETHEECDFLPTDSDHGNSVPQAGYSLSHSTTSVNTPQPDTQSPLKASSESGISPSHSITSQPQQRAEPEMDGQSGGNEEFENGTQMPPDFDSTHLFRLVPRAHHITDETVSVMSNFTEEYLGGSSSQDTMKQERSLTSMIFNASNSSDSTSDSSQSDSGCSESGGEPTRKNDKIEQIQKSYLAQLPPNSSTLLDREDTEETQKPDAHSLQASQVPEHPPESTVSIDTQSPVSTLTSVTMGDSDLTSNPPSSIHAPHPSLFIFDGVSGASSKCIPQLVHPLSSIQLHGSSSSSGVEVQGLSLAATMLTLEPDSLATALGNTLQADTNTVNTHGRNKARVHLKEILSVKTPSTAVPNELDVSQSQSSLSAKQENRSTLFNSPPVAGQTCQETREQSNAHPIPTSLGSEAMPKAARIAQSSQLLLGSAVQTLPIEITGNSANKSGIPEGVCEATGGDSEHDKNVRGKPFSEMVESDDSCVKEDDVGIGTGVMELNKSNLEMSVVRACEKVVLPSQLAEGFDPLHSSEKLPNVTNNSNPINSPRKTEESQFTTGTGVPLTSQPLLASKPQTVASQEQQSPRATDHERMKETATSGSRKPDTLSNSSGSSALLASLLLSQLESDLSTA